MKNLVRLLFLVCLSCIGFTSRAQVVLQIDTIINWPDTAITGQVYFPSVIVRNVGSTPFQGTLQIGFQTQNPTGATAFLYFSNTPIVMLSNDSAWLTPPNGFTFDTTFFRPGNNVVVVWPVASSLALIDTFTTNVYLNTTAGVNNPMREDLLLAPVPAQDYLYIKSESQNGIERVRIMDVSGREIPVPTTETSAHERELYLGNLPSGTYLVEVLFRNGALSRNRFLHIH